MPGARKAAVRPIVTKLKASGADALCMFGETVDLSRVVAQFYEQGLGGKMLLMDPTSGTFNAKFIELAKKNADGIVGASRFVASIQTPAAKKFVDDYRALYKIDPEKYAQAGYDCMKMVALAIKNAGSADRGAVRDALAAVKYEGPQGKAHFDEKNQLQIGEYIVEVKDGKPVAIAGPISGE